MKDFLRRRGPTIVVAALMFVAGGATVTTAQNLITSADIQNGAIRTVDLANNAVTSPKIADGHVRRPDIRNNAVNAPKIANGSVRRAKIANTAVNASKIANGAVTRAKIANNAVNAAKIANGQVTRAKIATNAVDAARIANGQVTRAKIATNAIDAARIANGQVTNAKLADSSVNSAKIANGSIQIGDISAAAQDALTAFSGPNWGVMDRNVIANGDSYLRGGPVGANGPPPSGVGSLGIRTGSPDDAAAFGNEVEFQGDLVSSLTAVSYSVFTTGENNSRGNNMPSIAFEINPNLDTSPGVTFATIVYLPVNGAPSAWTSFDAVADGANHWGGTGAAFAGTPCDLSGSRCNFAQLQAHLASDGSPNATILTARIGKGRDFAFSGAVDAFRINNVVYDFEPTGVFETTP